MLNFHSHTLDESLTHLASTTTGLSSAEAQHRMGRHGPNRLPEAKPRSPWLRLLAQLNNVLIFVLLIKDPDDICTLLQRVRFNNFSSKVIALSKLPGHLGR